MDFNFPHSIQDLNKFSDKVRRYLHTKLPKYPALPGFVPDLFPLLPPYPTLASTPTLTPIPSPRGTRGVSSPEHATGGSLFISATLKIMNLALISVIFDYFISDPLLTPTPGGASGILPPWICIGNVTVHLRYP